MAQINKPNLNFNPLLYTGNGSYGHAITGVGFQPDWVWIKSRSNTDDSNIYDAVRGTDKGLSSNTNSAQFTGVNLLGSFNTDGFTVDDHTPINRNGGTIVAWNWKAGGSGSANTDGSINTTATSVNAAAGFSISKYTGTGSNATVGHGLGAVPSLIIAKNTGGATDWRMYHKGLGNDKSIAINSTGNPGTGSDYWQSTTPTSSVFSIGTNTGTNSNGDEIVAYCFAEKKGFSKFNFYYGNGNADGPFVYTGFRPAFVWVKNTQQSGDHWYIWDNKRPGYNVTQKYLGSSRNNAEADSASYAIDMLSNVFKIKSTTGAINNNGEKLIYIAFAESALVGTNNIPGVAR